LLTEFSQLFTHRIGMGDAQDDKPLRQFGMERREMPCQPRPRIMPDDHSLLPSEMFYQRRNIFHQPLHPIAICGSRLARLVESALVDCDNLILLRQRFDLMPPRIPKFRDTVDQHHQRTFAQSDIMLTNAIILLFEYLLTKRVFLSES